MPRAAEKVRAPALTARLGALFLIAALFFDLAGFRYAIPGALAVTGLALLLLASVVPAHRSRRCRLTETPQHPAVQHPVHLRIRKQRDSTGRIGKVNDWAATHLGIVFGSVWVVWAFFIWPLAAQYMGAKVQVKTSYYAQSWIQLFALPLFVYIGNKLQRSSDAQSEVIHRALSHIATVSDQNKVLIEQNTELTTQTHALVTANTALTEQVKAALAALAAAPKPAPAKRLATKADVAPASKPPKGARS